MIVVSVNRSKEGQIREFIINGHAEYDKPGKDIVCAGVSAVSGTAIIGMERLLGIKLNLDVSKGHLKCSLPGDIPEQQSESVNLILETMVLGLKDIRKKYKKFVKVLDKEV